MACSGVSPSEWHPGRSGYSIKNPPPSAFDSGRIVNGYLSILASSVMIWILQLANKLYEVTNVPGLDRNVLRHSCSARPRVPECRVACAALTVNVHPEATRYNFQILDAPVVGVPPHPLQDLLSIGHEYMVPNTAPLNNVGRVFCQASGHIGNRLWVWPAATRTYNTLLTFARLSGPDPP